MPTGSFAANLVRAQALLWLRMVMLAGIGIAVSTFVRGPIAALFLFGLIVAGSLNSFVYRVVITEGRSFLPRAAHSHAGDTEHSHAHHDHDDHDHDHDGDGIPDHAPEDHHHEEPPWWSELAESIGSSLRTHVAPAVLKALPDFDQTASTTDLLVGREIPWSRLARQTAFDVGLRAGVVWIVGLWCFRRRELGLPLYD